MYGLPQRPLIHVALSAGLSALKTPSCHSSIVPSGNGQANASLCPICSTELHELARNVPYAHHARSSVEPDPVLMPSGRIYGMDRLAMLASKLNLPAGQLKDPVTEDIAEASELKKVYIM